MSIPNGYIFQKIRLFILGVLLYGCFRMEKCGLRSVSQERERYSMNNYYPRLRDLREDRDMTQEQIAAYLGMKQAQYSRYERGLRDIPTDVLIRLALLYNTSTDYILGLTDDSRLYRR